VGAGFLVQVTALGTRQDAEAVVRILKGRRYPVLLVAPGHGHANDNLYRVQVGPFASRDDAEKARAKLTREGFKPFIRH
jgi:cell division septation protein DedD